jgi:hypothetical protein
MNANQQNIAMGVKVSRLPTKRAATSSATATGETAAGAAANEEAELDRWLSWANCVCCVSPGSAFIAALVTFDFLAFGAASSSSSSASTSWVTATQPSPFLEDSRRRCLPLTLCKEHTIA